MPMPTKTVAYLRVSSKDQAESGLSLPAQAEKVAAYAQLYDLELVATEVDAGLSAKSLERPALQRALRRLRSGRASALLVVKLDRLTRSVRDLGALVDKYFAGDRCSLMSVGEQIDTRTAAGRLVLNVLASVAQWEREATGERTSAVLQHKAAQGEYTGGEVPYGFRLGPDGVHLEPQAEEQRVIALAHAFRQQGLSLRAIARELGRCGFVPPRGQAFHATQIRRMLSRAVGALDKAA